MRKQVHSLGVLFNAALFLEMVAGITVGVFVQGVFAQFWLILLQSFLKKADLATVMHYSQLNPVIGLS